MDITELSDLISTGFANAALVRPGDDEDRPTSPTATRLTDIPAAPLTWLWPGWIPAGMLTILGGHVGDGKSTVIAAIVAALTTGKPLPDGAIAPLTNVLILSAEDDPARVIRPRLTANHADLDRVFILEGATSGIDLRRDAGYLRTVIETHNIQLLVIDPLGSFLHSSDRASEGAIRQALHPLMDVVAHTGVAVLGVMRIGKTGHGRSAQRLVGSSAVPGIARSVIMVANAPAEEDDPAGHVILEVVKSNYARPPHPVALHLAADSTVHWHGAASTGIDDLAATTTDRRLTSSERADAAEFLQEYLREKSVNAVTVLKQAKDLGFSEITIRRAKKDLGIVSYRDAVFRGFWMWRLPDAEGSGEGEEDIGEDDRQPDV